MQKIKKFIEDFIQTEKNCLKGKFDLSLTDKDYKQLEAKTVSFFHDSLSNPYERTFQLKKIIGNEFWESSMKKRFEEITPRTLFQIKKYSGATFGDTLTKFVDPSTIYTCYLGDVETTEAPSAFVAQFFIGNSNEGLKIFYKKSFDLETGKWFDPMELKEFQVLNTGKLVSSEQYTTPAENFSLTDFNNNK